MSKILIHFNTLGIHFVVGEDVSVTAAVRGAFQYLDLDGNDEWRANRAKEVDMRHARKYLVILTRGENLVNRVVLFSTRDVAGTMSALDTVLCPDVKIFAFWVI